MTVVDLYSIQIIFDATQFDDAPLRYHATINQSLRETEENLTDLLPPGYRARIRRWDNPDERTDDA